MELFRNPTTSPISPPLAPLLALPRNLRIIRPVAVDSILFNRFKTTFKYMIRKLFYIIYVNILSVFIWFHSLPTYKEVLSMEHWIHLYSGYLADAHEPGSHSAIEWMITGLCWYLRNQQFTLTDSFTLTTVYGNMTLTTGHDKLMCILYERICITYDDMTFATGHGKQMWILIKGLLWYISTFNDLYVCIIDTEFMK